MTKAFLKKVHDAHSASETRALYHDRSEFYDAELRENGYVTPGRCAEALAAHTGDLTAPVLDFGCGSGLSGLALKLAGFAQIDGCDISPDMIEVARRKRLYRTLSLCPAYSTHRLDLGSYSAIAAVGVIGPGAAPIAVFDALMKALEPGSKLVMSLNDHALRDRANEGRISEWIDCAAARLLFRETGPHLPGINLKSNVYVIEKL